MAEPRLHRWPLKPGSPVVQFEIGPMQNLVYLVVDWTSKKAAWVDPQKDISEPLVFMEDHNLELTSILLTHTHHDHVAGLEPLVARHPLIPVILHRADAFRLKPDSRLTFVEDAGQVSVGALQLRAWNMPGHSVGALTFEVPRQGEPPLLLTGDTLFIRDCGRTDLPTGSTRQMFDSLQRYRQFPGGSIVLPGHHYRAEWWSTLQQEWAESPPFQCRNVTELEQLP